MSDGAGHVLVVLSALERACLACLCVLLSPMLTRTCHWHPRPRPPRLAIMNQMKASDELTDEQVRQLTFDMESAHNAFFRSLAA
jgi:hypothetical protein